MAVSSTTLTIRYTGNGSTVTAYSIPFPFLETSHIYAAVSSNGVVDAVPLDADEYTVTRLADGSGGSLRTVAAVTSPATILIYREVPLTQPTVFQTAGPLPAKSLETALDRTEMQIQQIDRRVSALEGDDTGIPTGDDAGTGNLTWETASDRGAVKPANAGQLGVEQSTQTVWIAQSTTTGDWVEFSRRHSNRIVIGLIADAGSPSSYQTAAATALTDWDVDAAIFAGDNNYNGASNYNADWAAFLLLINAGIAYPALGNHDVDNDGWEARLAAKFPYLPGNRRYYHVTLGDGLVDLFVLHSGRNSIFELVEADGNTVGSTQHTWFVTQLAASKARWKIAVFHHPPVSVTDDTEGRIEPNMAWPELARMDLVCCGHTHMLELLKWRDTQLVNLSAVADTAGTAAVALQGADSTDAALWVDDANRGIGRIVASQEKLTVEVWALGLVYEPHRLLHVRDARDLSVPTVQRETFALIAGADPVTSGTYYVCTIPAPMLLHSVEVGFAHPTAESTTYPVSAGEVVIASVLVGSDAISSAPCTIPDVIIPAGSVLTINVTTDGGKNGLAVTLVYQRFS